MKRTDEENGQRSMHEPIFNNTISLNSIIGFPFNVIYLLHFIEFNCI